MSLPPRTVTTQEALTYLDQRLDALSLAIASITGSITFCDPSGTTKDVVISGLKVIERHLLERGKEAGDIDVICRLLDDSSPPPDRPKLRIVE